MASAPSLAGCAIVVGTDGSEPARHAISFAAGLADSVGARLELVHVCRGGADQQDPGERAKGEDILQGELDRLRYLGLHATMHLAWGDPAEALAEYANHHPEAGLLVVGRRGAGALARALVGSVAARMTHLTQKPLVIVP